MMTAGLAAAQDSPFNLGLPEDLTGSTVTWVSGTYDPAGGMASTICFLVSNTSPDTEWITSAAVLFPATWVVACNSQDATDSGGNTVNFDCDVLDNLVTYADNDAGYGEIWDGETWGFCVDVTPPVGSWPPPQTVNWEVNGDGWGGEPHLILGSENIVPVELVSFSVE
jgi:hypothetical protein